MNLKNRAVCLVIFCTLLGAGGQILLKMGTNHLVGKGLMSIVSNPWLWGGYAAYGASALLLIIALKWGDLSILYPIIATTYIWVSVLSPLVFKEDSMNAWKWMGIVSIILGVAVLGKRGD